MSNINKVVGEAGIPRLLVTEAYTVSTLYRQQQGTTS